ncbi:MAG: RNA 2',3'-cyclic phosphodiesterase [Gemmatimonadaceae bacterium]
MRLFLAINLDPRVSREIVRETGALRAMAPGLRWVDEARLHLTLKFMGERPDEDVASIREALDRVAGRHRRIAMHVRHVGAFPNFRRARVVWIGVEQDARLELLQHDVEVECDARGFELDGRAFRPHLTLARVPEGTDRDVLVRLELAAQDVDLELECVVESIDLMRSTTAAGGSRYERLHAAALRVN